MSVFDINAGSTSSAVQAVGQTGSVVNQNIEQEGSVYKVNNQADVSQTPNGEVKIVLDGPLSEIYTKALQATYSKNVKQTEENVGQETQQMDAVMVADIHKLNQKKKEEQTKIANDAAYVYVTDGDALNGEGWLNAFNNVRIALDQQSFKEKVICVECKTIQV